MTIQDKIWLGAAEMLAGHNTGDNARAEAGQETIRQALAEISAGQESGLLAALNAAATEMMEIAQGKLSSGDMRAFLKARERFQAALAKLAGGERHV